MIAQSVRIYYQRVFMESFMVTVGDFLDHASAGRRAVRGRRGTAGRFRRHPGRGPRSRTPTASTNCTGLNQTLEHKIVESQRAEKRIQEQAALLDKARDAISVQDLDDRLRSGTKVRQLLYGWSASEASGQKACDLLYREPSQLQAAFQTVLRARRMDRRALRQMTRAGKEIIVESRWSLVATTTASPRPNWSSAPTSPRRRARSPVLAGSAHGKHRHPGRRHRP